MMKIHTTQNLSSLVRRQQSTNSVTIPNEIRIQKPEESMPENMYSTRSMHSRSVTFKGNKPDGDDVKKIMNIVKKVVGKLKSEASPKKERGDKILNSSFFNALLKVADYETVVQAAIAAVICIAFRPLTIMALPTKKGKTKEDNIYASSHSMASGMVGLVTAFALTAPFKSGANYVMKHMHKDLDVKTLKRLHPHLDEASIVDSAGKRVDEKLWKNIIDGKQFLDEVKDCQKLPEFTHIGDASLETMNKVLRLGNIDFVAQEGKKFSELVTKDGKNIYDVIDFSRLGIKVKEGKDELQILLKDIDKEFLEQFIKDSKGVADNNFGTLDINSVFKKGTVNGKETWIMNDIKTWKNADGSAWKFDLDSAYVSSPFETASYRPRISGARIKVGDENKLATYQKNAVGDELGSMITSEMLQAEKHNEGLIKALTWFPDLSFRVPIAVSTIALIPWILKNVFGMEKKPKKAPEQIAQEKANIETQNNKVENNKEQQENVNFKGKGGNKPSWLAKKMGEWYGKPLIESEKMAKVSEWVSKIPGGGTQAMTTLGSLITSGVYVQQTLSNKDLDSDRKRTLAINQGLCFVVPTIAAYAVDQAIKNWVKGKEYRYSGWQERAMDIAKYEGKNDVAAKIKEGLGTRLKGVRILANLATFTLIYRYATPVIITPVANWLGDKLGERNKAKKMAKAQNQVK